MHLLWLKFVNAVQGLPIISGRARRVILHLWGIEIHSSQVKDGVYFGGTDVEIGRGTQIRQGCVLDNNGRITIGERVGVGPEVLLLTSNHDLGPPSQRWGKLRGEPISIGDGVWIGAQATILPGVTIGAGCVIGSGALVTKDCEPNCLYGGVPARKLRQLEED